MRDAYGADVGNGNGYLAVLTIPEQDAQPMIFSTRDLDANEGMPTAAYVTPPEADPILVFDPQKGAAQRKIRRDPKRGVRAIKKVLRQARLDLPGMNRPVSPYKIYATVVRDMVRLGNMQRAEDGRDPIYKVVLTYPASFTQYPDCLDILNRMEEAVNEVELDGHHLEVVGRLPEPGAVGIDYLYYTRNLLPPAERMTAESFTVLVYDLGYGTFDLAAVTARSKGEPYQVWDCDGLPDVGGKDFDDCLVDELLEMMRDQGYTPKDDLEKEELRCEAVRAKHELSEDQETVVHHQKHRDGTYMDLTVTRSRFEEITSELLMSTVEKTQQMLKKQLDQGRQVDCVVLSGGASQMPAVRERLMAFLDPAVPVQRPFRPGRAVAYGAARYALGLPETVRDDGGTRRQGQEDPGPATGSTVAQLHTKHAYGVLLEDETVMEGRVRLLVDEGAGLPATAQMTFYWEGIGLKDCCIYSPKTAAAGGKDLSPEDCNNIVRLHFDLPQDRYDLTLTVDADYNITAALKGSDGTTYRASTADWKRKGGNAQ